MIYEAESNRRSKMTDWPYTIIYYVSFHKILIGMNS